MPWDLDELAKHQAYLKGHFVLTTGRHSDQFLLMARLTEKPEALAVWTKELAQRLKGYGARTVIGPAVGGIIPAYAVASEWTGSRMLFAEKTESGTMRFKRGFTLAPQEPVVVVEDVVTTGSSVDKVIQAIHEVGGVVVAVGALVDRGHDKPHWASMGFEALLRLSPGSIPTWAPEECPLCQAGIPLTRPKA